MCDHIWAISSDNEYDNLCRYIGKVCVKCYEKTIEVRPTRFREEQTRRRRDNLSSEDAEFI